MRLSRRTIIRAWPAVRALLEAEGCIFDRAHSRSRAERRGGAKTSRPKPIWYVRRAAASGGPLFRRAENGADRYVRIVFHCDIPQRADSFSSLRERKAERKEHTAPRGADATFFSASQAKGNSKAKRIPPAIRSKAWVSARSLALASKIPHRVLFPILARWLRDGADASRAALFLSEAIAEARRRDERRRKHVALRAASGLAPVAPPIRDVLKLAIHVWRQTPLRALLPATVRDEGDPIAAARKFYRDRREWAMQAVPLECRPLPEAPAPRRQELGAITPEMTAAAKARAAALLAQIAPPRWPELGRAGAPVAPGAVE